MNSSDRSFIASGIDWLRSRTTVTVARDAKIEAMPDRYTRIGDIQEPPDLAATNLEAGLNMALAIMPQDTTNRIVLVSDGTWISPIPAFLMSRRSIGGLSLLKSWATFAIRCLVILMLAVALARPVWEKRGEGLTVTVVLDRSQSIPLAMKDLSLEFLRDATDTPPRS